MQLLDHLHFPTNKAFPATFFSPLPETYTSCFLTTPTLDHLLIITSHILVIPKLCFVSFSNYNIIHSSHSQINYNLFIINYVSSFSNYNLIHSRHYQIKLMMERKLTSAASVVELVGDAQFLVCSTSYPVLFGPTERVKQKRLQLF